MHDTHTGRHDTHRSSTRRRRRAALAAVLLTGSLATAATPAHAAASDFAVNFAAAEPSTFSHVDGTGGAWGDGTGQNSNGPDVVESLAGEDFACGDKVVFFLHVTAEGTDQDQVFTADFHLAGRAVNGTNVGYRDAAISLEDTAGGPVALTATPASVSNAQGVDMDFTVEVADVDAPAEFVIRVVTTIECFDGGTSVVQAQLDAVAVDGDSTGINGAGEQTVPLKSAGDIDGGDPDAGALEIVKHTTGGDGTFGFTIDCTGTAFDSTESITTVGGTGSVTITGIEAGTECSATESANDDFFFNSVDPDNGDTTDRVSGSVEIVKDTTSTITFENEKKVKLTLEKFYDTNANGTKDSGEPGIVGWKIKIGTTEYTTGTGGTVVAELHQGSYTATEGLATPWINTTARSVSGLTATQTVRFGNVCLGAGGGLTLGFWSNRNGQALVGNDDLAMLVARNLFNANGTTFDPTNYAALKAWLLNGNATNMAYMLSVQLAAMSLNVFNGLVSGSSRVYAPGASGANTAGFISVNDLMAEANAALALNGYTVAQTPTRSLQEALKNALDNANNNRNFVQLPGVCSVPTTFTYPA